MADYVYTLGLIPVQEWIAQARRSRDLRAGSVYLWQVMAKLLVRLKEELAGVEIWTPWIEENNLVQMATGSFGQALAEPYGIPNRASGWCLAQDDDELRGAFQKLEGAVAKIWWDFRDESMIQLKRLAGKKDFWPALEPHWEAYRELTSLGEDSPLTLVWAALPAPHPREQARENLEAANALFAEVKRSRPARPWPFGRPIGKCTQCGQREAIGPDHDFNSWQRWHSRQDGDPWVKAGYRVDVGERLCYVCLAKRSAGYEEKVDFPSTGEVAARRWLKRLKETSLKEPVERLERTRLGRDDFGRALRGSLEDLPQTEVDELKAFRAAIHQGITAHNEAPGIQERISLHPPTYLALLTFDGDDMGRRVAADPDRTPRALVRFAETARELLKTHDAEAFYLAGDEGLAMAPAETALDLAAALRDAFAAELEEIEGGATLSAGIAFFEQGRPMRGAILAAREALRSAKEIDGKDALGVAVETASGSRWGFTARWGAEWTRIQKAAAMIRDGRLSPGWAYDAERFLDALPEEEWSAQVAEAARAELRRLFLRRVRVRGEGKPAEELRAARQAEWQKLSGETWWERASSGVIPPARPEQLHLIGFLGRQASATAAGAAEE